MSEELALLGAIMYNILLQIWCLCDYAHGLILGIGNGPIFVVTILISFYLGCVRGVSNKQFAWLMFIVPFLIRLWTSDLSLQFNIEAYFWFDFLNLVLPLSFNYAVKAMQKKESKSKRRCNAYSLRVAFLMIIFVLVLGFGSVEAVSILFVVMSRDCCLILLTFTQSLPSSTIHRHNPMAVTTLTTIWTSFGDI